MKRRKLLIRKQNYDNKFKKLDCNRKYLDQRNKCGALKPRTWIQDCYGSRVTRNASKLPALVCVPYPKSTIFSKYPVTAILLAPFTATSYPN